MDQAIREPYAVLGVPATATAGEIRRAYRRRLRQLHPDTGNGNTAEFEALLAAYRLLGNPVRRRAYDTECLRLTAALMTTGAAGPFIVGHSLD